MGLGSQLPAWRWAAKVLQGLRWAVVGGAARDLALGRAARDLDIVVDARISRILPRLGGVALQRNRYGGLLLQHPSGVGIDLWRVRDSWAFRQGLVDPGSDPFDAFPKTTFLNIDGLMWLGHEGRFAGLANFEMALRTRTIDIELESNPSPHAAAIRALDISRRYKLSPTPRLHRFIVEHHDGKLAKQYAQKRLDRPLGQLSLPRLDAPPDMQLLQARAMGAALKVADLPGHSKRAKRSVTNLGSITRAHFIGPKIA